MALDLSKLSALELPSKEIEVEILGENQTVKISALDDEESLRILSINSSDDIAEDNKQVQIRRIALEHGTALTEEEITLLMRKAASAANFIFVSISQLTKDFSAARQKIREEAKKNLKKTEENGAVS